MDPKQAFSTACDLMMDFAHDTGLAGKEVAPKRYLWTDAFAVCNFLGFFSRTGEVGYRDLAIRLVEQVHHILGRHREDDPRRGWISGLSEDEGERHPTSGGLRIGKPRNERDPEEPIDERLEWERDGQYFHYLTKWMHALYQSARVTGDSAFLRWGVELARSAYAHFTETTSTGTPTRMYWKMSIDLRAPLVPSMGQHDPLDGLVTFHQLRLLATETGAAAADLEAEIAGLSGLCQKRGWATDDPLGTGGLLMDALKMVHLNARGELDSPELLLQVLEDSLLGLEAFAARSPFRLPAGYRLAFRELGLSIGLKAIPALRETITGNPGRFGKGVSLQRALQKLQRYEPLVEEIDDFWIDRSNREEAWMAHRDINTVMLATSLAPEGFLRV